jgi:hypothetical protein
LLFQARVKEGRLDVCLVDSDIRAAGKDAKEEAKEIEAGHYRVRFVIVAAKYL